MMNKIKIARFYILLRMKALGKHGTERCYDPVTKTSFILVFLIFSFHFVLVKYDVLEREFLTI